MITLRTHRHRLAAGAAAVTAGLALAACSSASSKAVGTASGPVGVASSAAPVGGSSSCGTVAYKNPGGNADLSGLPANIKSGYSGYFAPVNKSAYLTFNAKPGPYSIGYSDSFSANSWRGDVLARLKKDAAAYQAAGLMKGVQTTNSNLDNNLQIQQITSMINQHVAAIIAIPNSPTAFNGVIKQAYDAGIPFVTLDSHVTSPYAINVDGNYHLTGALVAAGIAKVIGGKGDVLVVDGINGAPASAALHDGYVEGFSGCPGVKIAGSVEGQWSEATAKTLTLQYLATHPTKLAAVVNSGGMTNAVIQAFQQTGRQLVPIGDSNPDEGSVVSLRDHVSNQYVASTVPPDQSIDAALYVAIATLQGQSPKFDAVVANAPQITGADVLKGWAQSNWTATSADQAPAPPQVPFFPTTDMPSYFATPKPLPAMP
jgi:ribose transport system substrate-binding protein